MLLGRVVRSWVKITQGYCEIRHENLQNKFILIPFAYNLIIEYSWKRIEKIIREGAFDKKIKNPG